jgi:LAO/AO transport system kinase
MLDLSLSMSSQFVSRLVEGVISGSRSALSRSITLVESHRSDHASQAAQVLSRVASVAAGKATLRLGISGQPGAGKSTLIEALGTHLINAVGLKVAVLAVDPSSTISHGSILGDKTRMPMLSREPQAYVRPSPSSGTLGGLSRHTDEAVILCEAAGYDVIFLETVGVGQSESKVVDAADMVLLLVPPATGDALQGSKKGILELADLVIVSKSDGPLLQAARQTQSDYASAMSLQERHRHAYWSPRVIMASVETQEIGRGLGVSKVENAPRVHNPADIWHVINEFVASAQAHDGQVGFKGARSSQRESWMWQEADMKLASLLRESSAVRTRCKELRESVLSGSKSARDAAKDLVNHFIRDEIRRDVPP